MATGYLQLISKLISHLLLGTYEVSGDIGKVVNTIGAAGEGP
jgi:hypothetical protein